MHAARPGLFVTPPGSPAPGTQPLPALTADRTVYVNSATGSNANDGLTPGTAWQTLQFAWDDRQKYGELRATYRINLLGLGPYDMPVMGVSTCDEDLGLFIIAGDTPTVLATGTFTGDFAGFVLPTSAGLGVDTQKNRFCEVLTGNLAGAIFQIASNTDTSITVANKKARTTAALPIATGDTFAIWQPTTAINSVAAGAGTQRGPYDWVGGAANISLIPSNSVCHNFYKIRFTGAQWAITSSNIGFIACRNDATVALAIIGSLVQLGLRANGSPFGTANASNDRLYGAGLTSSGSIFLSRSAFFVGVYGSSATLSCGAACTVNVYGGRYDGLIAAGGPAFFSNTADANNSWHHFGNTVNLSDGAAGSMLGNGIFALTAGSCLRVSRGASLRTATAWGFTGGTTDAAGFGYDALNGGRIYIQNHAPNLTGGTAGKDLRTNTIEKANAFFAANGDAIGEPAFGSCVARISTS